MRVFLLLCCCLMLVLTVASSAEAQRGYVLLRGTGTVGSFDTTVNSIDQTVAGAPFGDPARATITPLGDKLFVDETDANEVGVLTTSDSSYTPLSIGSGLFGIAASPAGDRIYAVSFSDDQIAVIDPQTNLTTTTFAFTRPIGIAVSPDGTRLYVSGNNDGKIHILDATDGTDLDSIQTSGPRDILVSPDGTRLYVSSQNNHSVEIMSTTSNSVIGSVIGSQQLTQMALTPDGKKLYVAGLDNNTVTIIDTEQNASVGSIPDINNASGIAASADGKYVYASSSSANLIYQIDTTTDEVIDSFPALSGPGELIFTPGQAPTASFSATSAAAGSASSFNASQSTTPTGTTITNYDWDFGDGTVLTDGGATPQHTYDGAGTYSVTLTVTNSDGVSTEVVSNGTHLLRNGSETARQTTDVTISAAPAADPQPIVDPPATVLPELTLTASKKLKIKGAKSLTLKVKSDTALSISTSPLITNRKGKTLKQITPSQASATLKANKTKRLRFKLSKKELKRLKKQLRKHHRKLYLNVTVIGTDGTNTVSKQAKIRLVMPKRR